MGAKIIHLHRLIIIIKLCFTFYNHDSFLLKEKVLKFLTKVSS